MIDCVIDFDGVIVLLGNRNFVFLGILIEKGYDLFLFVIGI